MSINDIAFLNYADGKRLNFASCPLQFILNNEITFAQLNKMELFINVKQRSDMLTKDIFSKKLLHLVQMLFNDDYLKKTQSKYIVKEFLLDDN